MAPWLYNANELAKGIQIYVIGMFYHILKSTHCADTSLAGLERVQSRFLNFINVSAETALSAFNLAPLSCRRDIANLGIIYRAILKLGPPPLQNFFVLCDLTRRSTPLHQQNRFFLLDSYHRRNRDYVNRSVLGYVSVFTLLPDHVFTDETHTTARVKIIQQNLARLLKSCLSLNCWRELYSARKGLAHHPLRMLSR